jgi:hypothetical protein
MAYDKEINVRVKETDPLQYREINGVQEKVYDFLITGTVTISLQLTETEFDWQLDDLRERKNELQGALGVARSLLNPGDPAPIELQLRTVARQRLLAGVALNLKPGGLLA